MFLSVKASAIINELRIYRVCRMWRNEIFLRVRLSKYFEYPVHNIVEGYSVDWVEKGEEFRTILFHSYYNRKLITGRKLMA